MHVERKILQNSVNAQAARMDLHMLRKRKEPGADGWDAGFRSLLELKVITGYGVVASGSCLLAEGEVNDLFANDTAAQLVDMFGGADYPASIDVQGDKLILVRKGPADAFALGRKRTLCVCFNNTPFGIVVTTFRSPSHPHLVIPQVELCCQAVRV